MDHLALSSQYSWGARTPSGRPERSRGAEDTEATPALHADAAKKRGEPAAAAAGAGAGAGAGALGAAAGALGAAAGALGAAAGALPRVEGTPEFAVACGDVADPNMTTPPIPPHLLGVPRACTAPSTAPTNGYCTPPPTLRQRRNSASSGASTASGSSSSMSPVGRSSEGEGARHSPASQRVPTTLRTRVGSSRLVATRASAGVLWRRVAAAPTTLSVGAPALVLASAVLW